MSTKPTSFTAVIALWPKPGTFAREMGEKPGAVRAWRIRNSIPSDKFPKLVDVAKRWELTDVITFDLLTSLYKARWPSQSDGAEAGGPDPHEFA